MNDVEKREILSKIPLIKLLDPDLAEAMSLIIVKIGTERIMDTDEVLYSEGDNDRNTGAVLLDGSMRVSKVDANEINVSAPNLLGEMRQYELTYVRTATVTAAEKCVVLEFEWNDFLVVGKEVLPPEVQKRLWETVWDSAESRLSESEDGGTK